MGMILARGFIRKFSCTASSKRSLCGCYKFLQTASSLGGGEGVGRACLETLKLMITLIWISYKNTKVIFQQNFYIGMEKCSDFEKQGGFYLDSFQI